MNKLRIYLSGNMTPSSDFYYDWTEEMAMDLNETQYECSSSMLKDCGKYIVQHDLARLKRSDLLVVNLSVTDPSHHMTGAVVEVYEAFKRNIPVYAFTNDKYYRSEQANSPWIQQFVTKEFDSYDELLNHLLYFENI